jgi:ferredoxin
MPKLMINANEVEVEEGKRLVLAIEESGVNIGHRCGGHAKCTTCRVEFQAGEPQQMTKAERDKLEERGLLGQYRLSCQIICDHEMHVVPMMTLESEGWSDTGPAPQAEITPEPEWIAAE